MATVDNWTDTAKATNAGDTSNRTNSSGTEAIKITMDGDGAGHGSYQDITTVALKFYRLRFYYKNGAGDFAQINVYDNDNSADIIVATDMANSTSYSSAQDYFFQSPTGCTSVRIYLNGKNNADVVYFDDVSVMEVDITGVNAAGTVITGYNRKHDRRKGCTAIGALIVCEDNTARACINGDVPTQEASCEPQHGIELPAASSLYIRGEAALRNFKIVDAVSGSASKIEVIGFFQ